jgi:hypothetical protein
MFNRLLSLTRAYINHYFTPEVASGESSFTNDFTDDPSETTRSTTTDTAGLPQQVLDDLAVFSITPPGSLHEVIQARNSVMKQYHPDKFMSDSGKTSTANEIAQIYNAAFERLRQHYSPN